MGQSLAESSAAAAAVYAAAREALSLDLLALDEGQLQQTRYAQLGIVVMSLAAFAAFQEAFDLSQPAACAGFSLGEYSALGAAGVLELPSVLSLVDERSRLMQLAAEACPGAMYAILGLPDATVEEILAQLPGENRVYPVNYNCPGQLVIAGPAQAAEAAAAALKAAGAKRALRLNVNGAFHTPYMAPAAPGLQAYARGLHFAPARGPFFSNRTAAALPATVDWPSYLADHLLHPVRWTEEVQALAAAGATTFIEFGPGKTLTGLIKKILPAARTANVEDQASLKAAVDLVSQAQP